MAVGAWTVYNVAKQKLGNATINLAANTFRITLHTSASNVNTATLILYGSATGEVSEGVGYSSSGKQLRNAVWKVGTSAGQYKFDVTTSGAGAGDPIWTATGGAINNIKFAVIWCSGASANARHMVARSQLTSAQFNLASSNTLQLQMASAGIFTLA